MRKLIQVLCACCCVAVVTAVLASRPVRIHHESSSAFPTALQAAVDRLENGGRAVMGATAVMMNATAPAVVAQNSPVTFDGRYTCETYSPNFPTCQQGPACPFAGLTHTADPNGHTCRAQYTCQMVTCQTYDHQAMTCDPNQPICRPPTGHTTEPPPYGHTCDGQTCDGSFTCDFTADPRGSTCDAAHPLCQRPTFNAFEPTCNPMLPQCRYNNPGACTAQPMNPTCSGLPPCGPMTSDPRSVTCDPLVCSTPTSNPTQPTCDPAGITCNGITCSGTPTCDPMGMTCSATQLTCDPAGLTCNGPTCLGAPTCIGTPTCDPNGQTCQPALPTCDPSGITCSGPTCDAMQPTCDPNGPTCSLHYTCGQFTCSTFQPQELTCDPNVPGCQFPVHTTEPPPYNHTCEGATCDGRFTCDLTLDPRSPTCDARTAACAGPTFNASQYTCNPHLPQCRDHNPRHCTSQIYETCQSGNPDCPPVGVEGTTWGKVKDQYRPR